VSAERSTRPSEVFVDELLTFAQAAQRLGVGVLTIRQWVRTEQCPVVVVGRKRRIPAAWVQELIEAGWL
jgi:excisionase family DNA binding protein